MTQLQLNLGPTLEYGTPEYFIAAIKINAPEIFPELIKINPSWETK